MAVFTSLNELQLHLNTKIWEAMNGSVAQYIKDTLSESAQNVVYDSYSPVRYHRRGELKRQGNYYTEWEQFGNGGELYVAPIVESSPSVIHHGVSNELVRWVSEGAVPNIFNDLSYPWMGARNFVDDAKDVIKSSGVVQNKLKKAICG